MGLNLCVAFFSFSSSHFFFSLSRNIKRIVFSTLEKFDGESVRYLTHSEIKQIAGRAGRYKSEFPEGTVTSFSGEDNERIRDALNSEHDLLPVTSIAQIYFYSQLFPASRIVAVGRTNRVF